MKICPHLGSLCAIALENLVKVYAIGMSVRVNRTHAVTGLFLQFQALVFQSLRAAIIVKLGRGLQIKSAWGGLGITFFAQSLHFF